MEPTVSVIVATYRRDNVLRRAIESLAEQTYSNFEVIVVDDNDNEEWNRKVKEMIDEYRSANPSVSLKYIRNRTTIGSARTRNAGIEAATGEFVCFLDDDDLYLPDRIKNQVLPMISENADYGVTNLALYSESEKLVETRKRGYLKGTSADMLMKYHLMYHIAGTDTMMFRRDYLTKIGGFSPIDVGDEFYLMLKAIESGGKFLHVPVCDVKAYVHTGDGGLSSGQQKIDGENALYEYKKQYFDRLDRKSIRYIRMRHYAVIAYAYYRKKQYGRFLLESIKSFFVSPTGVVSVLQNKC